MSYKCQGEECSLWSSKFLERRHCHPPEVPHAKKGNFGSLRWIPMIQIPFNSSCVALQYETGIKFIHQAIPELHVVNFISLYKYSILTYKSMTTQSYLGGTKISSYQRPPWRFAEDCWSFHNQSPMPSWQLYMVYRGSAQAAAETVWVRTSVNRVVLSVTQVTFKTKDVTWGLDSTFSRWWNSIVAPLSPSYIYQ